jgi:acyl dehydratase
VRARAYAEATNDRNPAYLDGRYAPPLFGVVPTWDVSMEALNEVVPPEAWLGLLHAEQDMRFHRPLVPGMALVTCAEIFSVRVARSGSWVTVRVESEGESGELVLEQFSTMFIRGLGGLVEVGPERPAHGFPETERGRLVAEVVRHVDDDQTFRYRDASGDTNPIHVDEAYAKEAKLPGIIVHGLCTMAMCGSVVVDEVAGGDPARLARLAVRFSRPVVPGDDLTVSVYDAGDGAYAFEAKAREKLVVRDGWAEVRS